MKLLMNFQPRYRRFWRYRSHWEVPLWVQPQLHLKRNDPLGMICDAIAAQGKAWKYPHFQGTLVSRHFCRAQVEQKYFKAHGWGVVLPRSLPLRGLMTWQTPLWARTRQGRFKTPQQLQLQLHVLLRIFNAGLNEICLERKDPVPNYLFFGEQRVNKWVQVNWQVYWMPLLRLRVVALQVCIKSNSALISFFASCAAIRITNVNS